MSARGERGPRIVHLIDAPEATSVLAGWFREEWAPWYGPEGPGDAEDDLAACASRDALPICLVALGPEGEVLGTAALRPDSLGREMAPGPWLAALLVGRPYRRRGVGTALVAAIEAEAERLGFPAVYTSTDAAEGLMRRRGWEPLGQTFSLTGPVTIYRRLLGDEARSSATRR